MNPQQPNKQPSIEELQAIEKEMNVVHTVDFTKRELVAVFNILTQISMKYADSLILGPIVKKLEPIVTQSSNIKMTPPSDEIIGAAQEEAN